MRPQDYSNLMHLSEWYVVIFLIASKALLAMADQLHFSLILQIINTIIPNYDNLQIDLINYLVNIIS